MVSPGERDDRTALRRFVRKARGQCRRGDLLRGDAGDGNELGRHAVAEGDRARLVEKQRVDVARRLDRAARSRDDVEADQPVHAGDADGRQEATDRRRNETDEKSDQHRRRQNRSRIFRDRPQRDTDDQEDDGQSRQQDRQRQLVRGLLALGPFDERDHAIDEGRARRGRDSDLDEVGQHRRSAGDGRSVAAGLADDGGGFAGNRRFVDRSDAFDDIAVARDELARFDQNDVACAKVERVDALHRAGQPLRIDVAPGDRVGARPAQGVGLRFSAPFRHRLGEIGEQDREPEPGGDLSGEGRGPVACDQIPHEKQRHEGRDYLGHEDDGILRQRPRIKLARRVDRCGRDDLAIEQPLGLCFLRHGSDSRQKVLPPSIKKCSTTGPRDRAGKYCKR